MWIGLIALAGTIVTGAFSARNARATARVEQSKVDADAYNRAKAIYESALDTVEEQLERVRAQLDRVTHELAQEQDTSASLRAEVRVLRTTVATLERTIADSRVQMSKSGIPVPEQEDDSGDSERN